MQYRVLVITAKGATEERHIDLSEPWSGWVPTDTVIANAEQPRQFFDQEELARLGASLRTGQANPSTAIPHTPPSGSSKVRWKLGDGERRLRALRQEGLNKVWVSYCPGITEENLHEVAFKANCCRQGHTHAETACAIEREIRTGKKLHEIGDMVGKSEQWARGEHDLLKLHPTLLVLMDPPTKKEHRLPMSVAKALVGLSHEQQLQKWAEVKHLTKGKMALSINAQKFGAGATGRKRKPSDDVQIIKNRLRKIRDDLRFLNTEWKERIETVMPGVDVSLMTESIDQIDAETAALKKLLTEASAKPKDSNIVPFAAVA